MALAVALVASFSFSVAQAQIGPGWTLSLSGSATDPHQNGVSAAGGLRNVYLWLTCSTGASAFEANTGGSVVVAGFNGLNGVLNAGTPTELLLAIPGCPTGGAPQLLGWWTVWDTGGTLCLEPSESAGTLVMVTCGANAEPHSTVEVFGFSSDTSSPCHVGQQYCVSASFPPVAVSASSWGKLKSTYALPRLR
jgi:hypothetical protein